MAKVIQITSSPERPRFQRGDHSELAQHLAGLIVIYAEQRAKDLGRTLLLRGQQSSDPNESPVDAEWHQYAVVPHQKVVAFLLYPDPDPGQIVITSALALAFVMRFSCKCWSPDPMVRGRENPDIMRIDYPEAEGIVTLASAYLLHGRPSLGREFGAPEQEEESPP